MEAKAVGHGHSKWRPLYLPSPNGIKSVMIDTIYILMDIMLTIFDCENFFFCGNSSSDPESTIFTGKTWNCNVIMCK